MPSPWANSATVQNRSRPFCLPSKVTTHRRKGRQQLLPQAISVMAMAFTGRPRFARIARIAGNDQSLAVPKRNELVDHLGALAVKWIRQARTRKYLSAPSTRWLLTDDRDLDSLRGRADFCASCLPSGHRPDELLVAYSSRAGAD